MVNTPTSQTTTAPSNDYDLVIVGGGIYGGALLWEASHRGLRTLLLERNDFGSGTSANSLKTIHGGIRYLQQCDVKRSYESDREKVILRQIAPNLIQPLACAVESKASLTANAWAMRAGAFLMNRISQLSSLGSGRHPHLFSPAKVQRLAKPFSQSETAHYLTWEDAQVLDSERLCLAFIDSSMAEGAVAHNYSTVTGIEANASNTAHHIHYHDTLNPSSKSQVTSTIVIDCSANSELNRVGNKAQNNDQTKTNYVAGVNVVINKSFSDRALAIPQVPLAEHDKNSQATGMLFLSPWRGVTLAGTWYYHTEQATVDPDFVEQCTQRLHAALSQQGYTDSLESLRKHIIDVHFGFLPCTDNEPNAERSIVNQCTTQQIAQNWFRVEGNKYTTARLNAQKMIDRLARSNPAIRPSESHQRSLKTACSLNPDSLGDVWLSLSKRYGQLSEKMQQYYHSRNDNTLILPLADSDIYPLEVDYFAQDTQVKTLADLLYRRLNYNKCLPFNEQFIRSCAQRVADVRGWNKSEQQSQEEQVHKIEQTKKQWSEQ